MADVSLRDVKQQPVVQALRLLPIRALWARWADTRRHGFRFPLLAAVVILGSAWLFLGVLEDVATGDPLVDVDVIVHGLLQNPQEQPCTAQNYQGSQQREAEPMTPGADPSAP